MAVEQRATASPAAHLAPGQHGAAPRRSRPWGGGTDGNERLTALTGMVLVGLLAIIGVTILRLRPLLSVHLFVGMLLVPPLLLKLVATGYRFLRYYTHDAAYRRKGPPPALLRLIAPVVVLTTVIVMASGIALLFAGPSSRDTLLPIHKASFVVWLAFTALHVLGHLPGLPATLRADHGPHAALLDERLPGRGGRALALGGSLAAGVALAILLIPDFGPWLHSTSFFGGDH